MKAAAKELNAIKAAGLTVHEASVALAAYTGHHLGAGFGPGSLPDCRNRLQLPFSHRHFELSDLTIFWQRFTKGRGIQMLAMQ